MMQSVDQAIAVIQARTMPLAATRVPSGEAHGLVLAEPVLMEADSPPFDRALLDGFAVRSFDAKASALLRIVGKQDAGGIPWKGELAAGQCLAINTGAMLPKGADAVLMVERSQIGNDGQVRVMKEVSPHFGIQFRASQAPANSVALPARTHLTPAALAATVSAGAVYLPVYPRAKVAILTTGDELTQPGTPLHPGQIRNSNTPMLLALLRQTGQDPIDLGSCGDQREALRAKLEKGLEQADLLLVTGGMSMGTKDLVPPLLKELGVDFHIEKVAMKPGKPFIFGAKPTSHRTTYVAGLPGNPVSAFVTFHLFVRHILSLLTAQPAPQWITAQAAAPFKLNGDREFFEPCTLSHDGPTLLANPANWRGSADILSLARLGPRTALVRRPVNAPAIAPGDRLEVLPL